MEEEEGREERERERDMGASDVKERTKWEEK